MLDLYYSVYDCIYRLYYAYFPYKDDFCNKRVVTIVNQIAGITPAVRVADYSKRYDSSLPNLIAKRFTEPIME